MNCVLKYWFVLFASLLVSSLYSQEYRAEAGVSYELNRVEFKAGFQGRRIFDDGQYLNSALSQLAVEYELGKRFDIGFSIRYVATGEAESLSASSIEYESKTRITFDFGANLERFDNDLKLKNRLRFQINIDEDGEQKQYLREKVTFDYKLSNLFRPFAALEVYYQLEKSKLKAFRLYLGSEFDLNKHELEFYSILEAQKKDKTELYYMLGLAYRFNI